MPVPAWDGLLFAFFARKARIELQVAATWIWLTALFILAASAFCSGTETALTALGDHRARQLAEKGSWRVRLLLLWVHHPERVLSSLLIGNTIVNVFAGVLAGDIASRFAESHHGLSVGTTIAVFTAAATAIILVLGEIMPKTLAKRYPVRVAVFSMPVVVVLYYLLWPVTNGLVRATSAFFSLLGSKLQGAPPVTSEEIEYLIEMGTREGVLDEVKEELLNSVLEFADRVVKEIMVPRTRITAIDKNAPPKEVVRIVTENPFSRMPVHDGSIDDVVGVLLVRDIVAELRKGPLEAVPLEKYMKPAFFVPEQMKISRLLKEMQKRKIHMAIVVDEFGGTSGIATLEDVIEEIVGEIQDEGDVESAPVKALGDGIYLADASIPLRNLAEYLNGQADAGAGASPEPKEVRFPEDGDYETLGGFLTATAGRVPLVGALIAWDGLTFTVRAGDERRVTRVEIARRGRPASPQLPEPQGAR